jgi:broad specificity phosphatase PhoE
MSTIFVIRHGEKPENGVVGIGETGAQDDESLTLKGWARSGAWSAYFARSGAVPQPGKIFASSPDKAKTDGEKVGSKSKRPFFTVKALGANLGIDVDTHFLKGQEPDLATAITQLTGTTLVCWQHEDIPSIVAAFPRPPVVPAAWPDTRFDVIWRFVGTAESGWELTQICPRLMPDDSPDRIV